MQRSSRKVAVVAATDVNTDVTELSNEDSTDAGFCGEPFADNGELLSSLSPLLFSMKLFGLYFHCEDPHRRRTDDPEWNPATTTTRTSSNRLRVYATVVLILVWLNAVRFTTVFTRQDRFGAELLMKNNDGYLFLSRCDISDGLLLCQPHWTTDEDSVDSASVSRLCPWCPTLCRRYNGFYLDSYGR